MLYNKNYRRLCPVCDKWHSAAVECDDGQKDASEAQKQRVINAIGRYEAKRAKKGKRVTC